MPLSDILAIFERTIGGTVIDVTVHGGGQRYRIKFVDAGGRVRRVEFDARTGALLD
jgi:uncharacterized membrane protein YkoI